MKSSLKFVLMIFAAIAILWLIDNHTSSKKENNSYTSSSFSFTKNQYSSSTIPDSSEEESDFETSVYEEPETYTVPDSSEEESYFETSVYEESETYTVPDSSEEEIYYEPPVSEETDPYAYQCRNWSSYMQMPSDTQIASVSGLARSPYIAIYPSFSDISDIVECSVDIHADHQPPGTYLCPLDWWMDLSSLEEQYASVYNDYTEPCAGYCGLQCLDDGSRVFIMTVWKTFCQDNNGNVITITPEVIYPANQGRENQNMGEGSFVQCIIPYDWRPGRDYRVLLQQSYSETDGSVILTTWICDLATNQWTQLVSFDTHISNIYIRTFGGFLECFLPEYTGEVRSMELSNLRVRSTYSYDWYAADQVQFLLNGSVSMMDYTGSANFGADGSSIWAVTSGVSGLCETPSDSISYPLLPGETSSPY